MHLFQFCQNAPILSCSCWWWLLSALLSHLFRKHVVSNFANMWSPISLRGNAYKIPNFFSKRSVFSLLMTHAPSNNETTRHTIHIQTWREAFSSTVSNHSEPIVVIYTYSYVYFVYNIMVEIAKKTYGRYHFNLFFFTYEHAFNSQDFASRILS